MSKPYVPTLTLEQLSMTGGASIVPEPIPASGLEQQHARRHGLKWKCDPDASGSAITADMCIGVRPPAGAGEGRGYYPMTNAGHYTCQRRCLRVPVTANPAY